MTLTQLCHSDDSEDIVAVRSTIRNEDIDSLTNSISNALLNQDSETELEGHNLGNQENNDEMNQNHNNETDGIRNPIKS